MNSSVQYYGIALRCFNEKRSEIYADVSENRNFLSVSCEVDIWVRHRRVISGDTKYTPCATAHTTSGWVESTWRKRNGAVSLLEGEILSLFSLCHDSETAPVQAWKDVITIDYADHEFGSGQLKVKAENKWTEERGRPIKPFYRLPAGESLERESMKPIAVSALSRFVETASYVSVTLVLLKYPKTTSERRRIH